MRAFAAMANGVSLRAALIAVLFYLVYLFGTEIRADVRAMRTEHGTLIYYSRGICLNTAGDNESAQRRCFMDGSGNAQQ